MESNLKKDGGGTRGVIFAQIVRSEVSRCEGAGNKTPFGGTASQELEENSGEGGGIIGLT